MPRGAMKPMEKNVTRVHSPRLLIVGVIGWHDCARLNEGVGCYCDHQDCV